MARIGDLIENPITGQSIRIIKSATKQIRKTDYRRLVIVATLIVLHLSYL